MDAVDTVEVIGGRALFSGSELRRRLGAYFATTGVERAVLFGSYARGEEDEVSDVDLLVVERTALPFVERGRAHLPLFRIGLGVDLLIYTPEEYERLRARANPLIERIEREGVVVHERSER